MLGPNDLIWYCIASDASTWSLCGGSWQPLWSSVLFINMPVFFFNAVTIILSVDNPRVERKNALHTIIFSPVDEKQYDLVAFFSRNTCIVVRGLAGDLTETAQPNQLNLIIAYVPKFCIFTRSYAENIAVQFLLHPFFDSCPHGTYGGRIG